MDKDLMVIENPRFVAGRIIREIFQKYGQDYDDMRRGSWFYLDLPNHVSALVQQNDLESAKRYVENLFVNNRRNM